MVSIGPATLLQAQSAYSTTNTNKAELPETSVQENTVTFQNMVNKNFNSFASMKPEEILAHMQQVKAGGITSLSQNSVSSSISSLSSNIKHDEDVKKRAILGKASLSEIIASTSEAKATLQTAVAVRNKVLDAFEKIMGMPI